LNIHTLFRIVEVWNYVDSQHTWILSTVGSGSRNTCYLVHPHFLFFFKLDFSLPSKIWFVYPVSLLSMTMGQIIQTRYETAKTETMWTAKIGCLSVLSSFHTMPSNAMHGTPS
jgi:hypothetical protein